MTRESNRTGKSRASSLAATAMLLLGIVTAACSPSPPPAPDETALPTTTAAGTASTSVTPTSEATPTGPTVIPAAALNPKAAAPSPSTQETLSTEAMCPDGDAGGARLNDLAEHVYDGAVAKYLRENASGIGREITPDSQAYALMLLADDESHELCIEVPERCLRARFRRASSPAERDALLANESSYAYQRALTCLQRAGDAFAAQPIPEPDPAQLEATYRERTLPRLIGNMMPVAMLRDSSAYGPPDEELHRKAVQVWNDCLLTLSGNREVPEDLAERVSRDMTVVLDCVDNLYLSEPYPPPGFADIPPRPAETGMDEGLPTEDWTRAGALNRDGGEVFSVLLPPGWELTTGHGVDSLVGEITGDGVTLKFDLGWFSHQPTPGRYPPPQHVFLEEIIGGHAATLILVAEPPDEKREDHTALTAVFFDDPITPGNSLFMAGEGLTREEQEIALAIFRSIRMAKGPGQPAEEPAGPPQAREEHPRVALARRLAAQHLGLEENRADELVLEEWQAVTWPSPALGCPQEGFAYAAVLVEGFRIRFSHEGKNVTVHTREQGTPHAIIPQDCLEDPETAGYPRIHPSQEGQQEEPAEVVNVDISRQEGKLLMVITHHGPRVQDCFRAGEKAIHIGEDVIAATLNIARQPLASGNRECQPTAELREVIMTDTLPENGREYRVIVNGEERGTYLMSYTKPVRLSGPSAMAPSTVRDVRIQEYGGRPAGFHLLVNSSSPSGSCTEPAGFELRRKPTNVVEVLISHHQAADPGVRCTRDILNTQTLVPLGSDFEQGTEYRIRVNDWSGTLRP